MDDSAGRQDSRAAASGAPLLLACALMLALGAAPTAARAQGSAVAGAPVERAGPQAPALAQPPFAAPPAEAPLAAARPEPAAPLQVAPEGSMQLLRIEIAADPAGGTAIPTPGWKPAADRVSRLTLTHTPGAPLDPAWIRAQFAANGLLGAEAGFDRIAALVQLVNLAFVGNGYPNSGVLIEDAGTDGVLRLRLVMGRLVAPPGAPDALLVTFRAGHARGLDADFVRRRLPSARRQPLDMRALERDFRLLSDDPAIRTVQANVEPGAQPGEAALALEVDPQPRFDLFTTFANNRAPSVGAQRLGVGGSLRSWLRPGDLLALQYGSTRGLTDLGASYALPLFSPRWSLTVRAGYNNASVVDRQLALLDIRSREHFFEAGLSRTVIARPLMPGPGAMSGQGSWQPAITAVIGALIVHRRVQSSLLGTPFSFSPGSRDGRTEYDALRLTADFTRRSLDTVFAASLVASHGLGGTRSSPPGALTPSPFFTALQLQLNFARRITPGLLEVRLRFAGQWASGLLYSPERFAIGGSDTVRGYRESLLLADEAAAVSAELAQPFDLGGRRGGAEAFRWGAFTASVFADGALARNRIAPQPLPRGVASVGGKLVWGPAPWISAIATFAQPLKPVAVAGLRDLQDRGITCQFTIHPFGLARAIGRRL